MEIKNIYWIVVDSMRSYKGEGDTRFRIKYFDELESDFFNFTNAYTSAPSTVMSAASMFTGCETIKIARNYSDWKFNLKNIKPIEFYLNKLNFENIPIDNSKRAREMLSDLIGTLDYKYFLKGTSHSNNWSNQEVFEMFKNALKKSSSKKKFLMTWYDCRGDKNINKLIKDHITSIKNSGNYENSIIIINSDHGYPDPSAIQTKNIIGKGHDLIVTEDNIKVPLLMKIPGLKPKTINNRVSLIDILPTLSEILNFNLKNEVDGNSQLNKLQNDISPNDDFDRYIRTDTRLLLQDGKITSLINNDCKYVKYHDTKIEELYDLKNDPKELTNLINNKKYETQLKKLREKFSTQTEKIFIEQQKFLSDNLEKNFSNDRFDKYKKIVFFTNLDPIYLKLIKIYLLKKNNNLNFRVYRTKLFDRNENSEFEMSNILESNSHKFDNTTLIIVIDEKNYYRILDETFISYSKKFKCNRIFLDFNFEKNNLFFSKWIFPLLKYKKNYFFYKREPLLFFSDLYKLTKIMINQYILKKKVETPRGEDIKLQRDRYLVSDLEYIGNTWNHHQVFYNNLLNWGGTQKTIFSIVKNLEEKKISAIVLTRKISKQLIADYKLNKYQIHSINPKKLNSDKGFLSISETLFLAIKKLLKGLTKGLSSTIFRYIKNVIIVTLSFIFSDKITINSMYSAFRLRNNFDKCINNSKYFSSFLTKPNLILLFYYNYLMKKKTNVSIIINERNDITKQYLKKNKLLNYFYSKLLNKRKVTLLTNSLNTYNFFKQKNLICNLEYVYNDISQINQDHYDCDKKFNELRISCIGRIAHQKGQEELIKMISKIKNLDNTKFNFYGRGEHTESSKKIFDKFKKNFSAKYSSNIEAIYNDTDIVIINSYYEGQSNVILESLEYGKLMIINNRLKNELLTIYGKEIESFISFFESVEELEKFIDVDYVNKHYLKKINHQLEFFKNYKNNFKTITKYYSELR